MTDRRLDEIENEFSTNAYFGRIEYGDIRRFADLTRFHLQSASNILAVLLLDKNPQAEPLETPLYQLFYDGEEPPKLPSLPKRKSSDEIAWGRTGKEARFLNKLRRVLSKTNEEDRKLVLHMAQKMARR